MSSRSRVSATRVGMLRGQQRLERLERGTSLLRRKREALVGELFRIARSAADTRAEIDLQARKAWPVLLRAFSADGGPGLRVLGWPARDVRVQVRTGQLWGVIVSDIVRGAAFCAHPGGAGRRPRSVPGGGGGGH